MEAHAYPMECRHSGYEIKGKASPCWLWMGNHCPDWGYGQARHPSYPNEVKAHRLVWEMTRGPVPKGLTLDHLCRVRACCNPDHLEPVTQAENNRRGSGTKLNWDKVYEIRAEYAQGVLQRELGERYGVSRSTIANVVSYQTWMEEAAPCA